jgi:lysozyme
LQVQKLSIKKTSTAKSNNSLRTVVLTTALMLLLFLLFKNYSSQINFFFNYKFRTSAAQILDEKNIKKQNLRILNHHHNKVFGIDISEYQDDIDWQQLGYIDKHQVNFMFIRATVGTDRVDTKFSQYWAQADKKFYRGAYHYYRPNENSLEQANLFIKTVKLEKGDFPPVLDIEKLPKNQSIDSLKVGLKRWLNKVESHYGIKPIIYSGDQYFKDFLEDEFSEYTFWIAHYNFFEDEINQKWQIWQFTEKAKIIGIRGNVDINIFNGDLNDLKDLLVD